MNIATSVVFLFAILWIYLSLSFIYNLSKSFCFKFVSCKQHIVECCFLLKSESLCLLIGEFNTFTYIVIADTFGLTSVILFYGFYLLCFLASFCFLPWYLDHILFAFVFWRDWKERTSVSNSTNYIFKFVLYTLKPIFL